MGRRAFSSPRRRVNLNLDSALIEEFEAKHYDPLYQKVGYGELSKVVNQLLSDYLKKGKESERKA